MSLYRTWRPRTFADLVGQDAVVKTLTTALETGRLAHAYLFSGPRGSGKTSAAKILARCIECVNGPTATPDNTCENCVAILDGTALDVLEIDAASNRGIDEIRALRDAVKFAPAAMRKKVYIIDEAHMLTKEGANAFLKTLEEPPDWAVFILATTAPEALPPTILSRCQRYAFRRIAIPTMIERMREIAAAEGIAIDAGALGAIAYRADGGLRDALTMLEQVSSFAGAGPVDADTVEAAFGQTGRAFARALRDVTLDGDAAQALRIIDEASDAGADMSGLIRSTLAEFRHLLVARVNAELLSRDLAEDDARIARERAAVTPQARLVRALRLLADALASARNSGNARLELESAVLRFVLQGEDPTLDALASRLAALETGEPPAPRAAVPASPGPATPRRDAPPRQEAPPREAAPPPDPVRTEPVRTEPVRTEPVAVVASEPLREPDAAAAPVAPKELSLNKIRSLWQSIRMRAEGEKGSLRAGLSRATVAALDGDVLTLRVPDPPAGEVLRRDAATVKKAIAEVTGRNLDVRIALGAGVPPAAGGGDTGLADTGGEGSDDLMRYALEKLS
ncbi:MAG TPA: DNA polymerase III subunit gamma/tau [Candidatus Elarobacter sp.]|nr:DNA polymerase III subunit gamma/tau [Candidatus Elarobacter sp.]